MAIELWVMQSWSEIIFVIPNRTHAARSFNFGVTHMILDQSALHSVQLPLLIKFICFVQMFFGVLFSYYRTARKELDGHELNIVDLKYYWSQNKWLVFVVFLDLQLSSFFGSTMIFHQVAKKLLNFLYSDCFHSLWNIKRKSARELGMGRRQCHAGVNGFILFIFNNIALS